MRLTTFTDYGLRVLIYLAAEPGRRATIAEIASSYDVSENHLMKVVHFLGKAGVLTNVRGRGGGLELARPASSINVADVVRATESHDVPAECFDRDHNTCPIASICRLARVLDEAMKAFYRVLEGYTLEDLVHNRKVLQKVLFIPHAAKQRA
jgi:Rrf2 family nitric oxide-sensitive transcriptional repressor